MVHGGGFEEGNSARYANVDQVGRKFVSKGIIVIAIQYRLGVLGWFLTALFFKNKLFEVSHPLVIKKCPAILDIGTKLKL